MNVEASALGPVLSRGPHCFEGSAKSKEDKDNPIELLATIQ